MKNLTVYYSVFIVLNYDFSQIKQIRILKDKYLLFNVLVILTHFLFILWYQCIKNTKTIFIRWDSRFARYALSFNKYYYVFKN